jgi:anthranilate synthase component 1
MNWYLLRSWVHATLEASRFFPSMTSLHLQPSVPDFEKLAEQGNLIPVWAELAADYETPLSAYQKLRDGNCSFLFESAELTQHSGRFSILGSHPHTILTARDGVVETRINGQEARSEVSRDPLRDLEQIMQRYRAVASPALSFFSGGAVGYLAYDMVRHFEPTLPSPPPDALGIPDMVFFLCDIIVVFDHRTRKILIIAHAFLEDHPSPAAAYQWAAEKIQAHIDRLHVPLTVTPLQSIAPVHADSVPLPRSNTTQAEYEAMVLKAKEYIAAGDIFQVVPSQRFETDYHGTPIELFRALRHVNPSPYMFCMELPDGFSLVGSSPEVHVKCQRGNIEIRPIAGTRRRGATPEEDQALADEMLADPKERAEHIMLMDLARNDVGRAAEYGTVEVTEFMIVERYSHVMHIVSNVTGRLRPDRSAFDVLRATFPAGTVSGSPKVRAMEIISELEKNKRCAYAGAVGHFGFDGDLDSCITLRTCVVKDGKVYVQAGAGVVADSDPTSEYQETVNKAAGMLRAIQAARQLA